jgi:hypothetical protein
MDKPKDLRRHAAVSAILSMDTAAAAEHLLAKQGITAEEAIGILGLGLELNKQAMARKLMVESGDTLSNDTWERFKTIMSRESFEMIYYHEYKIGPWEGREQPDRIFSVWINRQYGLVLVQPVYTYFSEDGKTILNKIESGRCYYAWRPHSSADVGLPITGSGGWESPSIPEWRRMLSNNDWFQPADLYFRGYHHVEHGLIHKLQSMLLVGDFLPQWPEYDEGQYPLGDMFCTSLDYKTIEASYPSGPEHIARRSAISCQVYDSLSVLHPVMNVKPTWRK